MDEKKEPKATPPQSTEGNQATAGNEKTPTSGGKAKSLKETAREYFKHNAVDTLHLTADGYGFYAKGDAHAHALSLEDKVVTPFNRKDL